MTKKTIGQGVSNLSKEAQIKVAKTQLIASVLATAMVFFTIAIILYENYNKKPRFFSLIGFGITFVFLFISNFYNYKLTGNKGKLVIAIIYIAIALLIFFMTLVGKINI